MLNHFAAYGERKATNRAQRDAEFRRAVDDAKSRHNISDVAALDRRVRRTGKAGEFVALCAFHNERTPSMRLNDPKGTFHCFGCGAGGDLVKYVMDTRGLGFMDALAWLGASDLPAVDPAARAKAAAEDRAERLAAIEEARAMWVGCLPASGTPAETYLRRRGIVMPLPASIRFGLVHAWRDRETGEVGPSLPALIAGVVAVDGELTGVQRIFLREGGAGKAPMRKPKKSLGRIRGGALRLGPVAEQVILTEGAEDGLSLAQELPGRTVFAALGTGMMPEMELPGEVRSVVIAGQNDDAGRACVDLTAAAMTARGLDVRTMFPDPAFKDWNDQLRGVRQ